MPKVLRGDAVHRMLYRLISVPITVALAPERVRPRMRQSETTLPGDAGSDPEALFWYLHGVILAWMVLATAFGFLMIPLAYLGDRLSGHAARDVAAAVGFGLVFFATAGTVYVTALRLYAWPCRSRYKRSRVVDERCRRVLARVRLSDASLLVQAAVGILAGLWAVAKY